MRITRVRASNWRNFKSLDFSFDTRVFVVGPNAAGKSNLLDIFRFLGDIAASGGGLSSAVDSRGGISKVRSLFARTHRRGRLILEIDLEEEGTVWKYLLSIRGEAGGRNRPIVDEERVERDGEVLLSRPDKHDLEDPELLTQTHLEQISANQKFRPLAEYFSKVQYFHLVPQLIREPSWSSNSSEDPHGGDFIARINSTPIRTQKAWLRRIEKALRAAVPEFESLEVEVDTAGRPHLTAGYKNWRATPTRHSEAEFSDGTLRLIGLLWTVVSAPANGGVLLLEEPELSLNSAIVRMLPTVLATAQRDRSLQILLSTHAPELLDDEGVRPSEVLALLVTKDGTEAHLLDEIEEIEDEIGAGLPLSDVVHGLVAPQDLDGLIAVGRSK
ncbi:AAA family ATPase [Leucobacter rhizosphaerae]|uniref:AAA family ATPase n=1 Tax=Leucobacter rhizosphaerae TaxID=2932245 RepID=A0ABY4FTF6_9MICO|nr:ATP-binding protein [Leucobacter rhizosphaerae]UOQ59444.1 AAA family ATPase [Leucobacter rhizosphaerae]